MRILVEKAKRALTVLEGNTVLYRCGISLGACPIGHKQREGDGRTPEGRYVLCTKNDQSRFYISLGISYPNVRDAEAALADGRISSAEADAIKTAETLGIRPPWDTALGGFIMLHGEHPERRQGDWTAGCIAVRNEDMDELWRLCSVGTEIEILP